MFLLLWVRYGISVSLFKNCSNKKTGNAVSAVSSLNSFAFVVLTAVFALCIRVFSGTTAYWQRLAPRFRERDSSQFHNRTSNHSDGDDDDDEDDDDGGQGPDNDRSLR